MKILSIVGMVVFGSLFVCCTGLAIAKITNLYYPKGQLVFTLVYLGYIVILGFGFAISMALFKTINKNQKPEQ